MNEVNDVETVERALAPIIPSPARLHHDTVSAVIQSLGTYDAPTLPVPNLDHTISHRADGPSQNEVPDMLEHFTPVTPSFRGSRLNFEQSSDGAAAGPTRDTTDNSILMSSMVER
jgi:hypothetical protein